MVIVCEFTPMQLDVIQTALTQLQGRDEENIRQIRETWDAVVHQRAYGEIKKSGTRTVPDKGEWVFGDMPHQ